ncbi:hypothetical protein CCHL11_09179, partial [Colletotrichum chlorophyti]
RTLRTYSKRSRSAENEIPLESLKKRKTEAETVTTKHASEHPIHTLAPIAPSSSRNIPKSSILSYFKPCRSSSTNDSSDSLHTPKKLIDIQPCSPQVIKRMAEPRRLRLRPSTPILPATDISMASLGESNHANGGGGDQSAKRVLRTRTPRRSGLDMTDNSTLSQKPTHKERTEPSHKTPPKLRQSSTIQTTINLSGKPTFIECELCRIVYNPLHPNDVKFHLKRHKKIEKSRK